MSENADATVVAGSLKRHLDDWTDRLTGWARSVKGCLEHPDPVDLDRLSVAMDSLRFELQNLVPTVERVIYLDPRIIEEAAKAILHDAGEDDRFFLRIHPDDRGRVHQWTDVDGHVYQQPLATEVFEVTPLVRLRARQIRAAVRR